MIGVVTGLYYRSSNIERTFWANLNNSVTEIEYA
jgi:hypothetical protein